MRSALMFGVIGLLIPASPAAAHIVFKEKEAQPGKTVRATLVVGHGCGHSPTLRLRLKTPPGVWIKGASPLAGWTATEQRGSLDDAFSFAGEKAPSGITELTWTGRLDNHAHGSFSFDLMLADQLRAGSRVTFPIIQECEQGVQRWIDPDDSDGSQAPSLMVGRGA